MAVNIMKAGLDKVLTMLVLLACFSVKAQDRLGDCCPKVNPQWLFSYDERLETIIHEHLGEDFLVRCIYMPAFDPEWVIQLDINAKSGAFQLCVLFFRENLWYKKDGEVGGEKSVLPIEEKQASDLTKLVRQFIENKSGGLAGGCLDGESIQFEVKIDGDIHCGVIDCPADNSYPGRLVAIFGILKESVINGILNQEVPALVETLYNEASAYYSFVNSEKKLY